MSCKSTWSFEGQDVIASSLLRNIECGHYFDIGCASPKEISNTWFFYNRGWKGLAVDGRPLHEEWKELRPRDTFVQQVVGDGRNTLFAEFPDPEMSSCDSSTISRYRERFSDELITYKSMPTVKAGILWDSVYPLINPDLVSIDVEGFELEVLKGFDLKKRRPKLFIVEIKNFSFRKPSSLPVVSYLYQNGYSLVAKTPLDGFFIDRKDGVFSWIPMDMF